MKKKLSSFIFHLSSSKGFTLIELLVVIAVLGILAAGVFTAINPTKRINQANDANLKSNLAQTVQALQSYYTEKRAYPADLTGLTTNKDIKTVPTGILYVVNSTNTEAAAYAQQTEDATKYFCWDSTNGVLKSTTTTAPVVATPTCNN